VGHQVVDVMGPQETVVDVIDVMGQGEQEVASLEDQFLFQLSSSNSGISLAFAWKQ